MKILSNFYFILNRKYRNCRLQYHHICGVICSLRLCSRLFFDDSNSGLLQLFIYYPFYLEFFMYFFPKQMHTPTPAPIPVRTRAVTGLKNKPFAPMDWAIAKALPAYTEPIVDCIPAAIDAFATPEVVKPMADSPYPIPTLDAPPTAPPITTAFPTPFSYYSSEMFLFLQYYCLVYSASRAFCELVSQLFLINSLSQEISPPSYTNLRLLIQISIKMSDMPAFLKSCIYMSMNNKTNNIIYINKTHNAMLFVWSNQTRLIIYQKQYQCVICKMKLMLHFPLFYYVISYVFVMNLMLSYFIELFQLTWSISGMKMKCIQDLLLDTSRIFNRLYEKTNKKQQPKPKKQAHSIDEHILAKIEQMNFQNQQTLDQLLSCVPLSAYDDQLYDETDKVKVRFISNERRIKLFTGFLEEQKQVLEDKKKSIKQKDNIVPENYRGKAQFKIDNQNATAFEHFSFSYQDLEKLNKNTDINDNIIESYFKIMKLFILPPQIAKKTYFFSTFFMGKLIGDMLQKQDTVKEPGDKKNNLEQTRKKIKENYLKNVKKWYRKINLFKFKYLVVPMNSNSHWNCILILNADLIETQINKCKIIGLDSMGQVKPIFADILKIFLQLEMVQKNQKEIPVGSVQFYQIIVPRQTNHHDCGLYVICFLQRFLADEQNLNQLQTTSQINFLNIFAQQFMFTMRSQLKNLYYLLMASTKNSQRIGHIKYYIKNRKQQLQKYTQYDIIDEQYFDKYVKLCPNYSEQRQNKMLVKFYLDTEVNYYEKNS